MLQHTILYVTPTPRPGEAGEQPELRHSQLRANDHGDCLQLLLLFLQLLPALSLLLILLSFVVVVVLLLLLFQFLKLIAFGWHDMAQRNTA